MKKIILSGLLVSASTLPYARENVRAEIIFDTVESKIIAIFVNTNDERKKMKCEKILSQKENIPRIKERYKDKKEKIIKFNMTCSI
ncbi:MAG: hypothetical protein RR676_07875 [Acinetobacter sp.]